MSINVFVLPERNTGNSHNGEKSKLIHVWHVWLQPDTAESRFTEESFPVSASRGPHLCRSFRRLTAAPQAFHSNQGRPTTGSFNPAAAGPATCYSQATCHLELKIGVVVFFFLFCFSVNLWERSFLWWAFLNWWLPVTHGDSRKSGNWKLKEQKKTQ